MKQGIHPKWYQEAKVACVCGNTFVTGSTLPEIKVDVCAACHPFFTGEERLVDTAGQVDKFEKRRQEAKGKLLSKKEKRERKRAEKIKKQAELPRTLEELREKQKKGSRQKRASKTKS